VDALPQLTPFNPATMIQSLDERGCGLRVVFFKPESANDRYGHVIATVQNAGQSTEKVVPQLLSSEGMGADGWPKSAPLQGLSIESRPKGSVALLVGMSGQSHWSASVEAIAGQNKLIFDVACRVATSDWHLSSFYLVNNRFECRERTIELESILLTLGDGLEVQSASGSFSLAVAPTSQRPVRWKYVVELMK
jgi:hypothetical protein